MRKSWFSSFMVFDWWSNIVINIVGLIKRRSFSDVAVNDGSLRGGDEVHDWSRSHRLQESLGAGEERPQKH